MLALREACEYSEDPGVEIRRQVGLQLILSPLPYMDRHGFEEGIIRLIEEFRKVSATLLILIVTHRI